MTWLLQLALGVSALAIAGCKGERASTPAAAPAAAESEQPFVLTVISTNDVHGHIEQLPLLGGYLRNVRAARARDHGAVLLLDAGDMLQGTLESNLGEGAATIRAFNALGCAAASIGNHEFDFGPAGPHPVPIGPEDDPLGALAARVRESHFPWLNANLGQKDGGPLVLPGVAATTKRDVGGFRVGIVGGITHDVLTQTQAKNVAALAVLDLAQSVARGAQALRAQGVALVIALVHAGGQCRDLSNPDDLTSCEPDSEVFELARKLPEGSVDLIVAGHTHDAIAQRVNGIPIIEAYSNGRAFGRVDLTLGRKSGKLVSERIEPPHALCSERLDQPSCTHESYEGAAVSRDAAVQQAVAADFVRADEERKRAIGVEIDEPLERNSKLESALSNLLVDLVRDALPGADAAVNNGGSIRTSLPAGRLNAGQLLELFPFDNALADVRMTAGELAAMIRNNLTDDRGFLALSGLRAIARCVGSELKVELSRPDGRRVPEKTKLRVAMSDFLASGGDDLLRGIALAPDAVQIDRERMLRDVFAVELAARKHIRGDQPGLYDAAHPRVSFEGVRPLRCP